MLQVIFGKNDGFIHWESNIINYLRSHTNKDGNAIFNDENPCQVRIREMLETLRNTKLIHGIKMIIIKHFYKGYYYYFNYNLKTFYIRQQFGCEDANQYVSIFTDYSSYKLIIPIEELESKPSVGSQNTPSGILETQKHIIDFKNTTYDYFHKLFGNSFIVEKQEFERCFSVSLPPPELRKLRISVSLIAKKLNYEKIADYYSKHNNILEEINKHYERDIFLFNYSIRKNNMKLQFSADTSRLFTVYITINFDVLEKYEDEEWQKW